MAATAGWREGWQRMIDAVGTEFGAGERYDGADAVELGTIRRYLEPLELACPLHYDAEVARSHGYADVVAPSTSVLTYTIPPLWRPGEEPVFTSAERDAQPARSALRGVRTGLEPECSGFFATDMAIEWLVPATLGDRLHRVGNKLLACVPKETSVGRGAFLTWETRIGNQRGETVARLRSGTYSYEPRGDGHPRPAQPLPKEPPAYEPPSPVDWGSQRWWSDVTVGDELATYRFPLSVYRLVVAAAANRDFNSIHHNSEYARATGAPEMYANTLFLQGMWERVAREFIGLAGTIRSLRGFRMSSFNIAGDAVVVRARVARAWREDNQGLVELELRSENSLGVSVGPGSITISLPDEP